MLSVRSHLQNLQSVVDKNQKLIDDFTSRLLAFYGTQALPYSAITIYLCPASPISTYCNHVIFLAGNSCQGTSESVLGTVLQQLARMMYEEQKTALKKTINHFFLHYPSQHAYMAYKYFNKSLATAVGNGVFVEALTGSPAVSHEDQYMQGFAEAIYKEVKTYLNKRKEMDQAFLVKSVKHFEKRFPELVSDLSEILDRYVLFIDEAFDIKSVEQVFQQHFPAYSAFKGPVHHPNIYKDIPYYDNNAPHIFVLSWETRDKLTELCSSNPYLNRVKKSKLQKLKGSFDFYRDKQGRLYLFFAATNYTELDKLVKKLKQRKYL